MIPGNIILENKIIQRYKKHNIEYINFNNIIEVLKINMNIDLRCYYCNELLEATGKYPYLKVVSLDHKQPLQCGGSNTLENTCLCCVECNIVKGTMTAETFKKLLQILEPFKEEKHQIFKEIFFGRFANKLERVDSNAGNYC